MANIGDTFAPGERVPDSGFYECTTCGTRRHSRDFSTNVQGHVFPPSHHPGARWRLAEKRP